MSPLIGFLHAVLIVLAASGVAKLVQPAAASTAIRTARLFPLSRRRWIRPGVRLLGTVEVVVAVAALVLADAVSLAVAASLYVAFTLFLARLRSVDAGADCGCFGSGSAPAGPFHVVINIAAALACALSAAAAAAAGSELGTGAVAPLARVVADETVATAVPYWALVMTLAWLVATGPSAWAEIQVVVAPAQMASNTVTADAVTADAVTAVTPAATATTRRTRTGRATRLR